MGSAAAMAAASGVRVTQAASYYVAPTGADSNPGTLKKPFATLERAQPAAMPLHCVVRVPVYTIVLSAVHNALTRQAPSRLVFYRKATT